MPRPSVKTFRSPRSEDELVETLRKLLLTKRKDVFLGIGDDAAIVRISPPGQLVLTSDVLVEGEDFTADSDPFFLGRKTLNVSLSDLAAMGARPLHALLTLGLRREFDEAWVTRFAEGVASAAARHEVAIVGGDLSATATPFASVTAWGEAAKRGSLKRSGASPGDLLYVSGPLGSAAAGLKLLEQGYRLTPEDRVVAPTRRTHSEPILTAIGSLIRRQIDPRPHVEVGRLLAERGLASAALDLSDGLAKDLHRLCRASKVGAVIWRDSLPIEEAFFSIRGTKGLPHFDPLDLALYGGEDFALLFVSPPRKAGELAPLVERFGLYEIGILDDSTQVRLRGPDGDVPLPDRGFDHFATATSRARR